MSNRLRARRWRNFRSRADYAPEKVYRHRTHGWEYVPVHAFGDEPEVLRRLGKRPEQCRSADAWWGIDEDATLLESRVSRGESDPPRLFAKATDHRDGSVYLEAVFDAPFVTRALFEEAMVRFAEAGFPSAPQFRLRWGDPHLLLPGKVPR